MTERRDCISPAIIEAAANNNTAEVLRLLEYGHCPNTRAYDAATPLMLAAINGNKEMIIALLQYGADISAQDAEGCDAEKWARNCGHIRTFNSAVRHYKQNHDIGGK